MGYQNFFATRLATEIGAADTVITLENVPGETEGKLVLEARNPTQREIITYTGISGNQITGVVRGYGGTTAKPHLKNALVEMNLTAEDLQELYDLFDTGSVQINGAKLLPGSVTANKLDFTTFPKQESTTDDGNTPITSATPVSTGVSVSLTVPASGKVEVSLSAQLTTPAVSGGGVWGGVALTGANTIPAQAGATAILAITPSAGNFIVVSARTFTLDGLTPGNTTFTVWGWREGGSGNCNLRRVNLTVKPIQ